MTNRVDAVRRYGGGRMTGLWVDPTIPRFTRAELVAEMDATYGFSDGSFREYSGWVSSPLRNEGGRKGRLAQSRHCGRTTID